MNQCECRVIRILAGKFILRLDNSVKAALKLKEVEISLFGIRVLWGVKRRQQIGGLQNLGLQTASASASRCGRFAGSGVGGCEKWRGNEPLRRRRLEALLAFWNAI